MDLTTAARPLPPLTRRRVFGTEFIVAMSSLLACTAFAYSGPVADRPGWWWPVTALALALALYALLRRRTRRAFCGPWTEAVVTGALTGDAEVDLSAVCVVERHAHQATGSFVATLPVTGLAVFMSLSAHGSAWPGIVACAALTTAAATLYVTRPGARARALRTQYQRGWMPPR